MRRLLATLASFTMITVAARAAASETRDLARFAPGTLLSRGETELVLFQNVYTQTRFYDDDGRSRDAGGRATYSSTLMSWTRGLGRRVNLGVEASLRSVRDGAAVRRVPPAETDSRTALAWAGPRVEFLPWTEHPSLTAELGVRVPLARGLDGADDLDPDDRPEAPFLDTGDVILVGRVRADRTLSPRSYLYLELGGEMRVDDTGPDGGVTPLKAIGHWLAGEIVTLYVPIEVDLFWGGASTGNWSSQIGAGLKVRPRSGLELEALVTTFPAGRNAGAGHTLSVGVRLVRGGR